MRLKEYRRAIFCAEQNWPSSVRLRRERMNTTSGLWATCDRTWPLFKKCNFDFFHFVTLLTGSGNKNRKSGSVTTPEHVSSFQKWNPHVDITSGWPAIAPLNWRKRLFLTDVRKFAIIPFPVRMFWNLGSGCRPMGPISPPNLNELALWLLCEMIFWSFEPPSCFLQNGKFNFAENLTECV
jgi:hypothetical protein